MRGRRGGRRKREGVRRRRRRWHGPQAWAVREIAGANRRLHRGFIDLDGGRSYGQGTVMQCLL